MFQDVPIAPRPPYLAGLLVHVEASHGGVGHLHAGLRDDVLGQLAGHVGLAGAAGAGQDDAPVLHQQVQVALDDGLGDKGVEYQPVNAVLIHTCREQTDRQAHKVMRTMENIQRS